MAKKKKKEKTKAKADSPAAKKKSRAARPKRAKRRNVVKGRVYIKSTFNNTVITVTDQKGDVLTWSSGGVVGNTGSRKSTPFAAAQAARDVMGKAQKFGLKEVDVYVVGPGPGKETAVKALGGSGIRIMTLTDCMKFPHNGCRPKKQKR